MRMIDVDFAAIEKHARRERAKAVDRLIFHPILRLFSHAARSHRHHQGPHRRAAA